MAFLAFLASQADMDCNKEMTRIDPEAREICFLDGTMVKYEAVVSTIPLPELTARIKGGVPKEVAMAAECLDHTSGVIVSIGLSCGNVAPALWFYIYDEDIYPARVYAPNIKSPQNVPAGCGALQAEVYYSKYKPRRKSLPKIGTETVAQLMKMGLFKERDIRCVDVREEKYANIMFTPEIYRARKVVREYLSSRGILTAGRFGEWDYLWTGESILSGRNAARKVAEERL